MNLKDVWGTKKSVRPKKLWHTCHTTFTGLMKSQRTGDPGSEQALAAAKQDLSSKAEHCKGAASPLADDRARGRKMGLSLLFHCLPPQVAPLPSCCSQRSLLRAALPSAPWEKQTSRHNAELAPRGVKQRRAQRGIVRAKWHCCWGCNPVLRLLPLRLITRPKRLS